MRHVTHQSATYVLSRQQIETWVYQHLQKAAVSSLMSFPREPEDEDDENLDELQAKVRGRQERPAGCPATKPKPAPAGAANFAGKCNYCGKTGHKASACWK